MCVSLYLWASSFYYCFHSLHYTGKLYPRGKFHSIPRACIYLHWGPHILRWIFFSKFPIHQIKVEISFLVILIFLDPKLDGSLATPIGSGPHLDKSCVWKLLSFPWMHMTTTLIFYTLPESFFFSILWCVFLFSVLACSVWCPWVWTPRTRSACGTGGEAKSWQPHPVTPTG